MTAAATSSTWRWRAVDAAGRREKGVAEAESPLALRRTLDHRLGKRIVGKTKGQETDALPGLPDNGNNYCFKNTIFWGKHDQCFRSVECQDLLLQLRG